MCLKIEHRQLLVNAHRNQRFHNATSVIELSKISTGIVFEFRQQYVSVVVQHIAVLRIIQTGFDVAVLAL